MKDFFEKIACFMTGWNREVLKECGEASHRQLKKLASALLIMMILWGTIGYCFADRYMNVESIWGKGLVSLGFMLIVICVERVIILTVGKAWGMAIMRFLLAICMAVLGSCIFDQIIFQNDIQDAIAAHREDVVSATVKKRLQIYEDDIQRIQHDMDSIGAATVTLSEELQKRPTIQGTNVTTQEQVIGTDANGGPKKIKVQTVNTVTMLNPLAKQLEANNAQIQIYADQLESIRGDKKNVETTVRQEVESRKVGFLEELKATVEVVSESWVSMAFYFILFAFLTFLELFVLTIKMGDNKCDYDLIVEHQLAIKKNVLQQTENQLTNK